MAFKKKFLVEQFTKMKISLPGRFRIGFVRNRRVKLKYFYEAKRPLKSTYPEKRPDGH